MKVLPFVYTIRSTHNQEVEKTQSSKYYVKKKNRNTNSRSEDLGVPDQNLESRGQLVTMNWQPSFARLKE